MQNEDKFQEPGTLYDRVMTELFGRIFRTEETTLAFSKDDLAQICRDLDIIIDNIPDIPYHYRTGRSDLPIPILDTGNWVIEGAGKGHYNFIRLDRPPFIHIPADLFITDIPEATPDVVLKYGGGDEQAVLTRIRYNRLIDTFLSITAYHLQSHIRSSIQEMGRGDYPQLNS